MIHVKDHLQIFLKFNRISVRKFVNSFKPFQTSHAFNIETNRLICHGKQIAGYYVKYNTGFKCVTTEVPLLQKSAN